MFNAKRCMSYFLLGFNCKTYGSLTLPCLFLYECVVYPIKAQYLLYMQFGYNYQRIVLEEQIRDKENAGINYSYF